MNELKMQPVNSVSDIRDALKKIAEAGNDWFSSILTSDKELDRWISNSQLFAANTDFTYFLFRRRYGCKRCYIATSDISLLEHDCREMLTANDDVIITSVLDKNGQNKSIKESLKSAGFRHHAKLNHVMLLNDSPKPAKCKFPFADVSDLPRIKEIILENFSPYLDHIPDDDEMVEAIENNRVIVARDRDSGEVIALQSFEKKGKVLDGRYLASAKAYRKSVPIGPLLWKETMKIYPEIMKFTGWIKEGNDVIERFVCGMLNFEKDGLTENYYTNKNDAEYEYDDKT